MPTTKLLLALAATVCAASPAFAQDVATPNPPPPADKVEAGQNAAPLDATKVADAAKPADATKAADAAKPAVAAKPADAAKPAEAPKGPFTLAFSVAGVTDYRFRGISLSGKDPAFQPSITLSHASGFHVGTWVSNIADNGGDSLEVDLVGGFGKEISGITFDVSATDYVYPGTHGLNYWEFIGVASHAFGPFTLGGTFAYTPRQGDAAPGRGIYYAVNGAYAIPHTPISITGSFGIEDNGFYDNKHDYSIGVSGEVIGFTVAAAYIRADHTGGDPNGKGRVVLSLSRSFETNF